MNLTEFKESISSGNLPQGLSVELTAMWYDARGNWSRAHALVQDAGSFACDWVHAYLHRKEGDLSNAAYWYRRVKKTAPTVSIEEEWELLSVYFLNSETTT